MYVGYAVLFRHANDELNYCIYIIPGNPNVTDETLPYWHEHMVKHDANISQALGKTPKMERMKAGKRWMFLPLIEELLFSWFENWRRKEDI